MFTVARDAAPTRVRRGIDSTNHARILHPLRGTWVVTLVLSGFLSLITLKDPLLGQDVSGWSTSPGWNIGSEYQTFSLPNNQAQPYQPEQIYGGYITINAPYATVVANNGLYSYYTFVNMGDNGNSSYNNFFITNGANLQLTSGGNASFAVGTFSGNCQLQVQSGGTLACNYLTLGYSYSSSGTPYGNCAQNLVVITGAGSSIVVTGGYVADGNSAYTSGNGYNEISVQSGGSLSTPQLYIGNAYGNMNTLNIATSSVTVSQLFSFGERANGNQLYINQGNAYIGSGTMQMVSANNNAAIANNSLLRVGTLNFGTGSGSGNNTMTISSGSSLQASNINFQNNGNTLSFYESTLTAQALSFGSSGNTFSLSGSGGSPPATAVIGGMGDNFQSNTITVSSALLSVTNLTLDASTLSVVGGGALHATTFMNAGPSVLISGNGSSALLGTLTNLGIVTIQNGASATIDTLWNSGSFTMNAGASAELGTFQNSGNFTIENGSSATITNDIYDDSSRGIVVTPGSSLTLGLTLAGQNTDIFGAASGSATLTSLTIGSGAASSGNSASLSQGGAGGGFTLSPQFTTLAVGESNSSGNSLVISQSLNLNNLVIGSAGGTGNACFITEGLVTVNSNAVLFGGNTLTISGSATLSVRTFVDSGYLILTNGGSILANSVVIGNGTNSSGNQATIGGNLNFSGSGGFVVVGKNGSHDNFLTIPGGTNSIPTIVVGASGANSNTMTLTGGSLIRNSSNVVLGLSSDSSANQFSITDNSTLQVLSNSVVYVGYQGSGNTMNVGLGDSSGTLSLQNDLYVGFASSASNNLLSVSGAKTHVSASTIFVGVQASVSNVMTVANGAVVTSSSGYIGAFDYRTPTAPLIASNNKVLITGAGSLWTNQGLLTVGNAITNSGGTVSYGSNALAIVDSAFLITGGLHVYPGSLVTLSTQGSDSPGTLMLSSLSGGGAINLGNGLLSAGSPTGTGLGSSESSVFSGVISGTSAGTFQMTGPGTLTLSGNNDYAGSTLISGGTLQASNTTAFGSGAVILTNTGTMALATNLTVSSLNWSGGSTTLTVSHLTNRVFLTITGALNLSGKGSIDLTGNSLGSSPLELVAWGSGSYATTNFALIGVGAYSLSISNNHALYVTVPGTNGGTFNLGNASGSQFVISSGSYRYSNTTVGDGPASSNNLLVVANTNTLLLNTNATTVGYLGRGNSLVISNGAKVTDSNGYVGYGGNSQDNSVLITGSNSCWSNIASLQIGLSGSGTVSVVAGGALSARGLTIASNGGSAGTLNVGSPAGDNRAGASAISGILNSPSITFGSGSGTLNFNQSNTFTFSNVLSGNGSVHQLGTGTTIVTGSNTVTGTITISNGTLQIGNGGKTGSLGSGTLINNATLAINLAGSSTLSNVISGNGTLTILGSGSLCLPGNNPFSGTTVITAGTLRAIGSNALGNSTVILGQPDGATRAALFIPGRLTLSSLTWNGATSSLVMSNLSSGPVLSIAGSLNLTGTGTISLAGNPPAGSSVALLKWGSGNYAVTNFDINIPCPYSLGLTNNTLAITGFAATGGDLTLGNTAGVNASLASGTNRYSNTYVGYGAVSSGNSLRVVNPSTLLSNTNATYVGYQGSSNQLLIAKGASVSDMTGFVGYGYGALSNSVFVTGSNSSWLNRSTLQIGVFGSGVVTVADGGTLSANRILIASNGASAGMLNIGTTDGKATAGSIQSSAIAFGSGSGALNFYQTNTITFAAAITGSGSVNQLGTGTTILTGVNAYANTTISMGTLQIGSGSSGGSLGRGSVMDNANLCINLKSSYTLSNSLSGIGTLSQVGPGTTIVTGTNKGFVGVVSIANGTLQASNPTAFGSGAVTLTNTGALALATNLTVSSLNWSGGSSSLAISHLTNQVFLTVTGALNLTGTGIIDLTGNTLGATPLKLLSWGSGSYAPTNFTVIGVGPYTLSVSNNTTLYIAKVGSTPLTEGTGLTTNPMVSGASGSTSTTTNTIPGLGSINAIPAITGRPNTFPLVRPATFGKVVAWGNSTYGQTTIPVGLTNVVQLSTRGLHNLALRTNGTISAWGWNGYGQTTVPSAATNVVQVAAGVSFSAALRANGSVVAWGNNSLAQTNVPAGLTNAVQIAAGSDHAVALRRDGTVIAWGWNGYGQTNVPSEATNVVQVAAGYFHSAVLRADGTVVAWGDNTYGETDVPVGLTNVVRIVTGLNHTMALRKDGTVAVWGWNNAGQTNVPVDLAGVAQIASGGSTVFAITTNGTLVTWGDNTYGQQRPPAGVTGMDQLTLGLYHALGLRK